MVYTIRVLIKNKNFFQNLLCKPLEKIVSLPREPSVGDCIVFNGIKREYFVDYILLSEGAEFFKVVIVLFFDGDKNGIVYGGEDLLVCKEFISAGFVEVLD